ncbi:GNAT family N-acetyltransferase [Nonomuraea pusilla]|uniref:GNAT family N-acetyltransferase n=1 Tax=Nonomuraea pusilla TaxID=46177 RepID=UPI00332B7A63
MTVFRAARPSDTPSLYGTWAESFTASHVTVLYEQDPGRFERTFVAVEGAEVLAVVHWLPRPVRDASGGVRRVGCVSSVATRPQARGRGLVKRLLALAAGSMAEAGCSWSLLFTGTPGVYESSGWRLFDRPWTAGRLAPAAPPGDGWSAAPVGLDRWPVLAALRERHDADRPLTTVRSAADWTGRVPVWYSEPREILLLTRDGRPAAYAVADWDSGDVLEIGLDGGEAAGPLFRAVAARARERGVRDGALRAPLDPAVRAALPCLFETWERRGDLTGMARPILDTEDDVRAIVADPRAVHWTADYF